jgi:hypothetical protein
MSRFTNNEYAVAAQLLHEKRFLIEPIQRWSEMLADERGDRLIEALLAEPHAKALSPEVAVAHVQSLFENLAQVDPVVAIQLMARLWPVAGHLRLHEVCDAIDLWIVEAADSRVVEYLKVIAVNENNVALRRHYEGWVTTLHTGRSRRRQGEAEDVRT